MERKRKIKQLSSQSILTEEKEGEKKQTTMELRTEVDKIVTP